MFNEKTGDNWEIELPGQKKYDVFIAYSAADKERAADTVKSLEEQGLNCFLISRDLEVGESYWKAVYAAVKASRCVVFCSSPNSCRSDCDAWMILECARTLNNNARIIKMGLFEYMLEDYSQSAPKLVRDMFKSFFEDVARFTDLQSLIRAINDCIKNQKF